MMVVARQRILVDAAKLAGLIKNRYFDKNDYRLGEQTNQNSEIMVLIGQYLASLRILRALVI